MNAQPVTAEEIAMQVLRVFAEHGVHDGPHSNTLFYPCPRCIEEALARRKELFRLVDLALLEVSA